MNYTLLTKGAPIKFLLAEDDHDDQMIFMESIHDILVPIEVSIVADGEKVLEFFKVADNPTPDVIFLDVNMPLMTGIECLKRIRKNEKFAQIPCVILSTSNSKKDIEECYKHGANLYLLKPQDYKTLTKMINMVLGLNWKEYSAPEQKSFFITEKEI
ncbi:response regulator [Emticicia sp. C21]|uniref:response regulator n=1 Tax=Emticicia sp. C21 TaxID=2302915 RepID=UPI000E3481D3|nr:response regulator [Emticicia sp. C21]RFS17035.1 response regulator [Emticicia sp. C21]